MTARRRIPTYFSHSYRAEERDASEFFWRKLERHGFGFTVDSQSGALSTCHLEMVMRRSACFVAVIPLRPSEQTYRCSPFMVHEYGLAVRARKPRLVFAEKGISRRHFLDVDEVHVFDRDELASYGDDFEQSFHRLLLESQAYSAAADQLRGEVGLALPNNPAYREIRPVIIALLERYGYVVAEAPWHLRDPADIAFRLDRFEFVVVDVASRAAPAWFYPTLVGRFIPTLDLIHETDSGTPTPIPPLVAGGALRAAASQDDLVLRWHDADDLVIQLDQQLSRFDLPRQQFRSLEEGVGYIRSIGRTAGTIFLSTARADAALAGELGRALKLLNFSFFHYVYNNTIPLGQQWQQRLESLITASRVFVPLVSEAYWHSEWCRQELTTAQRLSADGQLTIVPYFLDDSQGEVIAEQGVDIADLGIADRIARIIADMDRLFLGA